MKGRNIFRRQRTLTPDELPAWLMLLLFALIMGGLLAISVALMLHGGPQ